MNTLAPTDTSGWLTPPINPRLAEDEIHVWRVELDDPAWDLSQFAATLSEEEKLRADRFVFDHDRKRFIVAHGVLRQLIAHYLHVTPDEVRYDITSFGKPTVRGLQFNMAHSDSCALLAFSLRQPLGVDVEKIRETPDEVTELFFTPEEREALRAKPDSFFNIWTGKEARVKASGLGLTEISSKNQELHCWHSYQLHPIEGYAAHLVSDSSLLRLSQWEYTCSIRSPQPNFL